MEGRTDREKLHTKKNNQVIKQGGKWLQQKQQQAIKIFQQIFYGVHFFFLLGTPVGQQEESHRLPPG